MKQTIYLRDELAEAWRDRDVFSLLAEQRGDTFRDKEGRRTLRFELNGRSYFLKYHAGVGWGEILKNMFRFRRPIISARNEWQAIERLHQLGIGTMQLAGYGERGWNPARRLSFVITDELTHTMSLEDLGSQWRQQPPDFATKLTLLNKIADISRQMHLAGLNHRDYYLCHFLLTRDFAKTNQVDDNTELFLIDLHRARQWRQVPERWLIKDLGSLFFSAHGVPLTQRDKWRFIRRYSGKSLRKALRHSSRFWPRVEQRALALLDKWHRKVGS